MVERHCMASIVVARRRVLFIEEISSVATLLNSTSSARAAWRLMNSKYIIPGMIVITVIVGVAFMFYMALFGLQPD